MISHSPQWVNKYRNLYSYLCIQNKAKIAQEINENVVKKLHQYYKSQVRKKLINLIKSVFLRWKYWKKK